MIIPMPMPIYVPSSSGVASNWTLNSSFLMASIICLIFGALFVIGFLFIDDDNVLKIALALLILTIVFLLMSVVFGHPIES